MMDEFYNNFHEFNEATKTELVNFIKSKTTAWISMSNSFELVSSCGTRELLLEPADDETKEDPTEALKNMIKKQLKNSVKVATTSMLSQRFMKFLENDADKAYTNLLSKGELRSFFALHAPRTHLTCPDLGAHARVPSFFGGRLYNIFFRRSGSPVLH